MEKLSDKAILFIKNNVIDKINHSNPLTDDDITEIIEYITIHYETGLLDEKYNKPIPKFEVLYQQAVETINEMFDADNIDLDDLTKKLL